MQYFIFWEFKPFFIFFFKCLVFLASAATPCNSLKRFLETICILLMTFRNFSIWVFDVQNNGLFLAVTWNKKICFKCKLQFLADNLRKSLVLNGVTHFGPKNYTFIDTHCQKVIGADSFKRTSFLDHVSHKNFKLIFFFRLAYLYY